MMSKIISSKSWLFFAAICGTASAQSFTATSNETAALGAVSITRHTLSPASSVTEPSRNWIRPANTTIPHVSYAKYPWKMDITTTVFWIGENKSENNPVSNISSSWDVAWETSFGGLDDPDRRAADFRPAAFLPRQNPFYVALPYNDVVSSSVTKDDAPRIIPWFKQCFKQQGKSVCRDRWIAIRYNGRMCYAQWSDCGPFITTDASYVFGDARPTNTQNDGAGLDISPAVRDYLGFGTSGKCDWRFVDANEVSDGPWCRYGDNNQFARTGSGNGAAPAVDNLAATRLEQLRRQRDEWFRLNGNSQYQQR